MAACTSNVAPAHNQRASTAQQTAAPSTTPREQQVQKLVHAALEQSDQPVAVAVLAVQGRRPLALEGRLGGDPAKLTARPGSTVKPLLAWLAAEAGVLTPNQTESCSGAFADGYHCFATHGTLSLPEAIAVSCNVYAFELASRLGLARIANGFERFGFGRRTGVVAEESVGWLADPEWATSKSTSSKQRWELLVGTGHGPIEVTPLQLSWAYAELVSRLTTPSDAVSDRLRWEIMDGLRRVVEDERGTAHAAAIAGLQIGGKTGTAESGRYGDANAAENSWFVGVMPLVAPEVVVAVLVIGGGTHDNPAAPIAGRIFAGLASASIVGR